MTETSDNHGKGRRIKWKTLGLLLLVVVFGLFIASLVATYALPRSHAGSIVDRFPYPVALIGYGEAITYRTLAGNLASVRSFYENQDFSKIGMRVDFSTEDGQKRLKVREKEVLNKMIEDEAIMYLAKERGIRVSETTVREGLRRKLEEYGSGEEVKKSLDRLYGWTIPDFEEKVVRPSLYEEKLQESFLKETDASAAKDKIRSAQEALRGGMTFEETAKKYSEGQTAAEGGELGWFRLTDLTPALQKAVSAQKTAVAGDVVESDLGFHIVLIEETKKEKDMELYRLRQIFVKKAAFADWLSEKMKRMSIRVLSPEYRWNADEARAEFRDRQMIEFEKQLFEKAQGDASFFF